MEKPKITDLAREMTAFCQQSAKEQSRHPKRPRIAEMVLGAVVAALLVSSKDAYYAGWGRRG